MLTSRTLILAYLVMATAVGATFAADALLLVGQSPVEASFVGAVSDGTCQFQVADQLRSVSPQELVRWSTMQTNLLRKELLLVDGSRLVLADAWTGQQPWQLADNSFSVTTKLLGKISLPREQVSAIVLHAPVGSLKRTQFLDQLLDREINTDRLRLINGDQLAGQLIGLANNVKGSRQLQFLLESTSEPLQVSEDRIAAIVLGQSEKPASPTEKFVIGLRDGSLLRAKSLVANAKQLRVRLAGGTELTGSDVRDVVHLRSLATPGVYLSDLAATDYRHVPYLEIPWSYRRDRNVLGGPLQTTGRRYAKGLGMHTAARLVYRLDTAEIAGRFQHFVATLAIDDAAAQRGSVIFRVYLEHEGEWQQAYASPVIRSGEPPVPIMVELDGAKQLALVTDFADRGDERDYANWLEARLE